MQYMYKTNDYEVYLTKKEVHEGHIYLKKNSEVVLYMGRTTTNGEYCFYKMGLLPYRHISNIVNCRYENGVETIRPDIWDKAIIQIINAYLQNPLKSDLNFLVTFPQLVCEIPYKNLDFNLMLKWYANQNLDSLQIKQGIQASYGYASGSEFVKVKELVPGQVYSTTKSGHRSKYIYLGRARDKYFLWKFCSRLDGWEYTVDPKTLFNDGFESTKTNKKVRLMEVKGREFFPNEFQYLASQIDGEYHTRGRW